MVTYGVTQSGSYKVKTTASGGRTSDFSNAVEVPKMTYEKFTVSATARNATPYLSVSFVAKNVLSGGNPTVQVALYTRGNRKITDNKQISLTNGVNTVEFEVTSQFVSDYNNEPNNYLRLYIEESVSESNLYDLTLNPLNLSIVSTYDFESDTITTDGYGATNATEILAAFWSMGAKLDKAASLEFAVGSYTIYLQITGGTLPLLENAYSNLNVSGTSVEVDIRLYEGEMSGGSWVQLCTKLLGNGTYPNSDFMKYSDTFVMAPMAPVIVYNADTQELEWTEVEGATSYEVYRDDSKIADVPAK